jgi:hypothetical protein
VSDDRIAFLEFLARLAEASPVSASPPRDSAAPALTNRERTTASWEMPDPERTAAGGLLFLLPVLARLGFSDWCDAANEPVRPEILTRHIFHTLLSRLDIAPDDPAWILAEGPASEDACAFRREIPAPLHDYWLTRCRQLLRRRAHIGLASLVMRPAHLAVTGTHADVFFRLTGADVRIRRAGLDADPGWVPWFGKVVAFHYEDRSWT